MDSAYSIRPVTARDAVVVADLLDAFTDNVGDLTVLARAYNTLRAEEAIRTTLEDAGRALLAFTGDDPVGLAYIQRRDDGLFYMSDLYTAARHEGRGVASALLEACRDYAQSKGADGFYLHASATFPAVRRFYEKRGGLTGSFTAAGTFNPTPDRTDPAMPIPAYLMRFDCHPSVA